MAEEKVDDKRLAEIFENPDFLHGMDIGQSIGAYETAKEAQKAYDLGEIELWLDFQRGKTREEWIEWHKKHGSSESLHNRWK